MVAKFIALVVKFFIILNYAELLTAVINASLEFVIVNSHLAGLLEEGEHQPPTKVRHPQRGF